LPAVTVEHDELRDEGGLRLGLVAAAKKKLGAQHE